MVPHTLIKYNSPTVPHTLIKNIIIIIFYNSPTVRQTLSGYVVVLPKTVAERRNDPQIHPEDPNSRMTSGNDFKTVRKQAGEVTVDLFARRSQRYRSFKRCHFGKLLRVSSATQSQLLLVEGGRGGEVTVG